MVKVGSSDRTRSAKSTRSWEKSSGSADGECPPRAWNHSIDLVDGFLSGTDG